MAKIKSLEIQAFYYSLSPGAFRLLASMQRFESARRLQILLDFKAKDINH
jgi:hypothetical protein